MGSSCSTCLLSDTPTLSAWALPFIFVLCCAVGTTLAPDLELPHSAFSSKALHNRLVARAALPAVLLY